MNRLSIAAKCKSDSNHDPFPGFLTIVKSLSYVRDLSPIGVLTPCRITRAGWRWPARQENCGCRHGGFIRCWRDIDASGRFRRCCPAKAPPVASGSPTTPRRSSPRQLREQWLILEAPPLAPVVGEIRARCEAAGLRPPSYVAIRARAASLCSPKEIAKQRSANPNHLRRLKPRPGYIGAPRRLAVTQIDRTRRPISNLSRLSMAPGAFVGRAHLTILVDVFSRCTLGFRLTLEAPSTLSVALCLAHPICPKEAWLESRGVAHAWPTLGRPEQIMTDSAKSPQSGVPKRLCRIWRVDPASQSRLRARGRSGRAPAGQAKWRDREA